VRFCRCRRRCAGKQGGYEHDEIEELFPGFKAFLDATEQEIPRSNSKRKRKTHYSGKEKRHTVKTQITVNKAGLIIHKTRHARGSRHD